MRVGGGILAGLFLGMAAVGRGQLISHLTTDSTTQPAVVAPQATSEKVLSEPTTQPQTMPPAAEASTEPLEEPSTEAVGVPASELQKVVVRANLDQARDQ